MLKKLMLTTALSGLMITGVMAQDAGSPPASTTPSATPAPSMTPSAGASASASQPQFISAQKPDQWLASKFKGTDVIGASDEKIGDVSDMVVDRTGKVEAFVVSVGGFLGIGTKDVALAPSSFQVVPGDKSKNESDKLRLSMSKDQLKQAANFEPYNPPRTTTGAAGGASGGMTPAAPAAGR